MFNMQEPREQFYQYSDIDTIKEAVFGQVNEAIDALNFF